jgi:hypothetical protein
VDLSALESEDVISSQNAHHQAGVVSHLHKTDHFDDSFYIFKDFLENCTADTGMEQHYPWDDLTGNHTSPSCSETPTYYFDYQKPILAKGERPMGLFDTDPAHKGLIQPVYESSSSSAPNHKQPQQGREAVVKKWVVNNSESPYPEKNEFLTLVAASGLSSKQVKNALSNYRARLLPSKLSNTHLSIN